jgi:hypothetical protein
MDAEESLRADRWSAVCASPLNPTKPRRRSVTPVTIQICVPAGMPINSVCASSTRNEPASGRSVIRRCPLGGSTWIVPDDAEGGSSLLTPAAWLTGTSEMLHRKQS